MGNSSSYRCRDKTMHQQLQHRLAEQTAMKQLKSHETTTAIAKLNALILRLNETDKQLKESQHDIETCTANHERVLGEMEHEIKKQNEKYKTAHDKIRDVIETTDVDECNIPQFLNLLNDELLFATMRGQYARDQISVALNVFSDLIQRRCSVELTIDTYFKARGLHRFIPILEEEGYTKMNDLKCSDEQEWNELKTMVEEHLVAIDTKTMTKREHHALKRVCLKWVKTWLPVQNKHQEIVQKSLLTNVEPLSMFFGTLHAATIAVGELEKSIDATSHRKQSPIATSFNEEGMKRINKQCNIANAFAIASFEKAVIDQLDDIDIHDNDGVVDEESDKGCRIGLIKNLLINKVPHGMKNAFVVTSNIKDTSLQIIKNQCLTRKTILLARELLTYKPARPNTKAKPLWDAIIAGIVHIFESALQSNQITATYFAFFGKLQHSLGYFVTYRKLEPFTKDVHEFQIFQAKVEDKADELREVAIKIIRDCVQHTTGAQEFETAINQRKLAEAALREAHAIYNGAKLNFDVVSKGKCICANRQRLIAEKNNIQCEMQRLQTLRTNLERNDDCIREWTAQMTLKTLFCQSNMILMSIVAVAVLNKWSIPIGVLMSFGLVFWAFTNHRETTRGIPHPFITYGCKTLLFFFQILTFLTKYSVFNFDYPIYMDASDTHLRQKLWLNVVTLAIIVLFCGVSVYHMHHILKKRRSLERQGRIPILALDQSNLEEDCEAMGSVFWNVLPIVYVRLHLRLLSGICDRFCDQSCSLYGEDASCTWNDAPLVLCNIITCTLILVVPAFIWWVMKRYKMKDRRAYEDIFAPLILSYHKNCCYYSSFDLFRRALLIVIASIPTNNLSMRASLSTFTMGSLILIHSYLMPFKRSVNNHLESFVLLCGFFIATSNITDNPPKWFPLLVAILATMPLIPVPFLFWDYCASKSNAVEKLEFKVRHLNVTEEQEQVEQPTSDTEPSPLSRPAQPVTLIQGVERATEGIGTVPTSVPPENVMNSCRAVNYPHVVFPENDNEKRNDTDRRLQNELQNEIRLGLSNDIIGKSILSAKQLIQVAESWKQCDFEEYVFGNATNNITSCPLRDTQDNTTSPPSSDDSGDNKEEKQGNDAQNNNNHSSYNPNDNHNNHRPPHKRKKQSNDQDNCYHCNVPWHAIRMKQLEAEITRLQLFLDMHEIDTASTNSEFESDSSGSSIASKEIDSSDEEKSCHDGIDIKFSRRLTEHEIRNKAKERFSNEQEFMKQYVSIHSKDAIQTYSVKDHVLQVIDPNIHCKRTQESLYIVCKPSPCGKSWKTTHKLYTAEGVEKTFKIPCHALPKAALKSTIALEIETAQRQIQSLLVDVQHRHRLIKIKKMPWTRRDKIPIYNKTTRNGLNLMLTKEEFVAKLKQFMNRIDSNPDNIHLVSMLRCTEDEYNVETAWIVDIGMNRNIAISLKADARQGLMVKGIHLDIRDEHKLAHAACDGTCLSGFTCDIDRLEIGPPEATRLYHRMAMDYNRLRSMRGADGVVMGQMLSACKQLEMDLKKTETFVQSLLGKQAQLDKKQVELNKNHAALVEKQKQCREVSIAQSNLLRTMHHQQQILQPSIQLQQFQTQIQTHRYQFARQMDNIRNYNYQYPQ